MQTCRSNVKSHASGTGNTCQRFCLRKESVVANFIFMKVVLHRVSGSLGLGHPSHRVSPRSRNAALRGCLPSDGVA
jgi:hypothetical protein